MADSSENTNSNFKTREVEFDSGSDDAKKELIDLSYITAASLGVQDMFSTNRREQSNFKSIHTTSFQP